MPDEEKLHPKHSDSELENVNEEAESARFEDQSIHEIHSQLLREQKEPVELYKPIPMALLWGIFVLFTWAGVYMTSHSGDYRADVFDPDWRPGAADGGEPPPDYASLEWLMERGERQYNNNCSACHQADGKGLSGVYPPLAGSPWVLDGHERFAKILLRGLQGEISVLGNTYNGAMPSYGENGSNWKDRDIAAVMTYVNKSFGNDAELLTPDMVKAVRDAIADKSGAWSSDELLAENPLP